MSAFAVAGSTWVPLARGILWMPFPFAAVLWPAATLHDRRVLEIGLTSARTG